MTFILNNCDTHFNGKVGSKFFKSRMEIKEVLFKNKTVTTLAFSILSHVDYNQYITI